MENKLKQATTTPSRKASPEELIKAMHDCWILRGKGKNYNPPKSAGKAEDAKTNLAEVDGSGDGKPCSYCGKVHGSKPCWKKIKDEKKARKKAEGENGGRPHNEFGGRGRGRGRGGRGRGRGNGRGNQGCFEGNCNFCGAWGHKSNTCWHKPENAHLRNANYRPLQNQEATGANIEIVLPFMEVESSEEFYCTLVETESKSKDIKESQGEFTSVAVIQELGNIANGEEMLDVKSAFQDIVVRKSEEMFPELNNSDFEQDSSDRFSYREYTVNGTTITEDTEPWTDLDDDNSVQAEIVEIEGGPFGGQPVE